MIKVEQSLLDFFTLFLDGMARRKVDGENNEDAFENEIFVKGEKSP